MELPLLIFRDNNSAGFKEFPNGIKVSYRNYLVILCSLKFINDAVRFGIVFVQRNSGFARTFT